MERERLRRIKRKQDEAGHSRRLRAVTELFEKETSQSVNKQAGNSRVRLLISQSEQQRIDGAVGQLLTGY